jgi:GNAT superfamily N-acetyltransferase
MRVLTEKFGVWAFLAEDDQGRAAGVLTLNECASIYAGGKFREISELNVAPQFRAEGVGQKLLGEAVRFGREQMWGRLEVGAPDVPRWDRTVSFYRNHDFAEVGPRLSLLL